MNNLNNLLKNLSDKELYSECKKWGFASLQARWKFEGLLPEVSRRRLYEKKGYKTIYDFARILCGMSFDQVNRVFSVYKLLIDTPILQNLLIEGKVSVNKLSRITSIATTSNQEELAKKVQILSQKAIEAYVRALKNKEPLNEDPYSIFEVQDSEDRQNLFAIQAQRNEKNSISGSFNQEPADTSTQINAQCPTSVNSISENLNGSQQPITSVRAHKITIVPHNTKPNFDFEIINAMSPELKSKIKVLIDKGIDINQILLEFLNNRDRQIEQELTQISQEVRDRESTMAKESDKQPTRYTPKKTVKILIKKFGTKCSEPSCTELSQHVHHEKQFAKYHTHDPNHLKPLCKAHHELRHISDPRVQKFRQVDLC